MEGPGQAGMGYGDFLAGVSQGIPNSIAIEFDTFEVKSSYSSHL
jgi:hypothetical protein